MKQEQARLELQNASGQSGLAQAEADLLAGYGLAIVGVSNAPGGAQRTVLYDYSDGKKQKTVDFLAKRYNAQVIKQPGQRTDVDLAVVIGSDYEGDSTSQAAQ